MEYDGYISYKSNKNALENKFNEENNQLENKFNEENNQLENKFNEEKNQLKKKYKEERNQIEKQHTEEKNQLVKKYDYLKKKLASEYELQLQNDEDKLKQYIIKLVCEKNECKKSLNKNEQFKKNVFNNCMCLKKIFEDEIDDSESNKNQSLIFVKLNEKNNEKKNKDLSHNENNGNKIKKGQNDERNNILRDERTKLSKSEGNVILSNRKRYRNE